MDSHLTHPSASKTEGNTNESHEHTWEFDKSQKGVCFLLTTKNSKHHLRLTTHKTFESNIYIYWCNGTHTHSLERAMIVEHRKPSQHFIQWNVESLMPEEKHFRFRGRLVEMIGITNSDKMWYYFIWYLIMIIN